MALLLLVMVVAAAVHLTHAQNNAGVGLDEQGNLLVSSEAGKTVFVNGVNVTSLLERLEALERVAASTTTTTATANGTLVWVRTLGGAGAEGGYSVATDSAGNAFITGYTTSASLNGSVNTGNQDAFVAKYSSSGALVWVRLLGGTSTDQGNGVATDAAGNVFVTGDTFSATLNGSNANAGDQDAFLAKYSNNGTLLWVRLLGGNGSDGGGSVATDSAGNAFLTGYTFSATLNGSTNAGGQDAFVAKFSNNGTLMWVRLLGGSGNDVGSSVATDSAGNINVAGFTNSATLNGSTSAGSTDAFIAKYDNNGSRLWVRLLGSNTSDVVFSVATDSTGNVFVAGHTFSASINGSNTNAGGADAFVGKYDNSGSLLWIKLLGGAGTEQGNDVATDVAGNVLVTGYTTSATLNGSTITTIGAGDVFLAEFNSSGSLQWIRILGEAGADEGRSVAIDSAGSVFVAGLTNSASLNGSGLTAGQEDAFLAKFV
eukprot:m.212262 g.212262  ORF g.212262 m.212262 type:complete len:485 (-) comp19943_c0_seq1:337-1791(-)